MANDFEGSSDIINQLNRMSLSLGIKGLRTNDSHRSFNNLLVTPGLNSEGVSCRTILINNKQNQPYAL